MGNWILGFQASEPGLPTWANKGFIRCCHWVGVFELGRRLIVAECHWLGFMSIPGRAGSLLSVPSYSGRGKAGSALIGLDSGWSDPERAKAKTGKLPFSYARASPTRNCSTLRTACPCPSPRGHMPRELWVLAVAGEHQTAKSLNSEAVSRGKGEHSDHGGGGWSLASKRERGMDTQCGYRGRGRGLLSINLKGTQS